MSKTLVFLVMLSLMLSSCIQRLICPAYQSAYIYDKEELRKKFSYFNEDSTPKIYTASKTKYLVAVPESYRQKYKNLQTVEMNPVYPELPDSLQEDYNPDFMLAERDFVDSTGVAEAGLQPGDSAYAITKKKEKYNVDQDIYMWYFRNVLVLPDVRAALASQNQNAIQSEEKAGFFKRLFGRKNNSDLTDQGEDGEEVASDEGGGLFKFLRRNRNQDGTEEEEVPTVQSEPIEPTDDLEPIPTETQDPVPQGEGF